VPELWDEVMLDDDPVVGQRGSCQRPTAGLALGCFDGQPPAQIVGKSVLGDRIGKLTMLVLLGGDPGLGLVSAVEALGASDASAVGRTQPRPRSSEE